MKTLKSKALLSFTALLAVLFVVSLSAGVFADDGAEKAAADTYNPEAGWKIPPPVKRIKNPLEADRQNLLQGKVQYEKHCASCHGSSGKGDGSARKDLESDPGDFTAPQFHALPDGTLLFMIKEGKDEMKSFKSLMSDREVWQTVLYMRTLK